LPKHRVRFFENCVSFVPVAGQERIELVEANSSHFLKSLFRYLSPLATYRSDDELARLGEVCVGIDEHELAKGEVGIRDKKVIPTLKGFCVELNHGRNPLLNWHRPRRGSGTNSELTR
jgi:hypothetical protein